MSDQNAKPEDDKPAHGLDGEHAEAPEAESEPLDPSEPDTQPAQEERLDPGAPGGLHGADDDGGDPLVALKAEAAELKDQLLRAMAEGENLRRRLQKEKEDAAKYAAVPLARDLLGVADNLARALEAMSAEAAEGNEAVKNLLAGVEMTQRELEGAFAKHGIQKVDPQGEKLNPHTHEAMFEVPTNDQPAGTVVQVIQPGYILADRLLRPARVGVAKPAPEGAGREDS